MINDIRIVRSRRRSITLSVNKDLTVTVKAPHLTSKAVITSFVERNEAWISRRLELQRSINGIKETYSSSTPEGRKARKEALAYLSQRAEYWAELMGVKPSKIRLSSAEKRYGSCNTRGEISYSVILMIYPQEYIDGVIVHELAHLKQMNHSKAFYKEIEKVMPDYRERMKKMKKTA